MTRLLPVLLVLIGGNLAAQATLPARLAIAVCDCLQTITDEAPRAKARACLRAVANANARPLAKALDRPFDPARPADLDALAELIARPLALNCPIVEALYEPDGEDEELRWSDRREAPENPNRLVFDKNPPADTGRIALVERAPTTVVAGRLLVVKRGRAVVSVGPDEQIGIEVPGRLQRRLVTLIGQEVRLDCRREWRLQEQRIPLVWTGQ